MVLALDKVNAVQAARAPAIPAVWSPMAIPIWLDAGPRSLPASSPGVRPVLIDAARQLRRWSALRLAREPGLAMGTIQEASVASAVGAAA